MEKIKPVYIFGGFMIGKLSISFFVVAINRIENRYIPTFDIYPN